MRALAGVGVLAGLGLVAGEGLRSRRMLAELHAAQDAARHDDLTGLLNRAGMGVAVDQALTDHVQVGLLLVDLHGFKRVNDVYGHLAGDEVLVKVAARITAVLVTDEAAARHGGDEYSVLTPAKPGPWMASRMAALLAAVNGPVLLDCGAEIEIAASIGSAVSTDADELWRLADHQERAAKKAHHRRAGVA